MKQNIQKQKEMQYWFDYIVNQLTMDELIRFHLHESVSEDVKLNISAFARWMVNGHVGWIFFPEELKIAFRQQVVNLYRTADAISDMQELHRELFQIILKTIPDGHCYVAPPNNGMLLSLDEIKSIPQCINRIPETSVGINSAFYTSEREKHQLVDLFRGCVSNNVNKPITIMQMKDIGILGVSSLSRDPSVWAEFQRVFYQNVQNWKSIIIDLRGNRGGEAGPLSELLCFLGGIKNGWLPSAQKSFIRNTPEAFFLQKQKGESFEDPIEREAYFSELEILRRKMSREVSGCIVVDNYNVQKYNNSSMPICILTDRLTGSAAEAIVYQSKYLTHSVTIGENTCGMCQYGRTTKICLPSGYLLTLGTIYRIYETENVEGNGFLPDIVVQGKDAFVCAKERMLKKRGTVLRISDKQNIRGL